MLLRSFLIVAVGRGRPTSVPRREGEVVCVVSRPGAGLRFSPGTQRGFGEPGRPGRRAAAGRRLGLAGFARGRRLAFLVVAVLRRTRAETPRLLELTLGRRGLRRWPPRWRRLPFPLDGQLGRHRRGTLLRRVGSFGLACTGARGRTRLRDGRCRRGHPGRPIGPRLQVSSAGAPGGVGFDLANCFFESEPFPRDVRLAERRRHRP